MDTTTLDPNAVNAGVFSAVFGAFLVVYLIITLAVWILQGFAFYNLYKKAGQKNPWLAFIPVANLWPYMWTIKKSAWNLFWLICPIANVVFAIIWMVRLFKAFNINPLWALVLIGSIIPFINSFVGIFFIVLYCYMGFSKNVKYNPNFDQPNVPPNYTA